jgi:hypothetical protein
VSKAQDFHLRLDTANESNRLRAASVREHVTLIMNALENLGLLQSVIEDLAYCRDDEVEDLLINARAKHSTITKRLNAATSGLAEVTLLLEEA